MLLIDGVSLLPGHYVVDVKHQYIAVLLVNASPLPNCSSSAPSGRQQRAATILGSSHVHTERSGTNARQKQHLLWMNKDKWDGGQFEWDNSRLFVTHGDKNTRGLIHISTRDTNIIQFQSVNEKNIYTCLTASLRAAELWLCYNCCKKTQKNKKYSY